MTPKLTLLIVTLLLDLHGYFSVAADHDHCNSNVIMPQEPEFESVVFNNAAQQASISLRIKLCCTNFINLLWIVDDKDTISSPHLHAVVSINLGQITVPGKREIESELTFIPVPNKRHTIHLIALYKTDNAERRIYRSEPITVKLIQNVLSAPRLTFYDDPVRISLASPSRNMHLEIEATDVTQGEFDWVCRQNTSVHANNTTNLMQQSGRHVLIFDFCNFNGEFSLMYVTVPITSTQPVLTEQACDFSSAQQCVFMSLPLVMVMVVIVIITIILALHT